MDIDKYEDQLSYAMADAESITEMINSIDYSKISINNSHLLYSIKVLVEHEIGVISQLIDDITEFRKNNKE